MVINTLRLLHWALVAAVFVGCVSSEIESGLSGKPMTEKPLSEIFKDMERLPAIEDPEPEFEELKYEEVFAQAYLMRGLTDVASEDPMPVYLKNLLKSMGEQVRDVDPAVKDRFANASLNYLVAIMDPRVPLDPQLEQILQKLWQHLNADLPFTRVPVVEGLEELKTAVDRNDHKIVGPAVLVQREDDNACAQAVYMQYGAGARACGLELNESLNLIQSNYIRRMFEAEARFLERKELLFAFELEQLPVAVEKFREVLTAIRQTSTDGEVKDIRANIGYLAAAYAYHLRLNVPLWHEYGAQLTEWYYYKEIELIEEIRIQKEAEADLVYQHCIDWINTSIIEEVKASCPGDEPILY